MSEINEFERADVSRARLAATEVKAEGYARRLIEASLDPLVTIRPDGRVSDVNGAAVRATGVSRETLVGSRFSDYFTEPERAEAGYKLVLSEGEVHDFPLTLRHVSGRTIDVLYNATIYRDDTGTVQGVFAAARDVTERKRAEEEVRRLNAELEQRVIERTAELEAANKELEAFSYSVSHDLRAPLRAIDGFSQILQEEFEGRLSADGQDALRRVRGATRRMGELIDDLLKLSRVSQGELRHERVDLSEIALDVAEGHRRLEPDRQVEVVIVPGAVVEGDPQLLRVALENLLDNAFKFTSKRADAQIEFGTRDNNGRADYFVRDNGVGFDMAYVGRLFGAFQRLHSAVEFPGTGIGLATVRRIVRRHGGSVRAEGAPGEGATFSFTL